MRECGCKSRLLVFEAIFGICRGTIKGGSVRGHCRLPIADDFCPDAASVRATAGGTSGGEKEDNEARQDFKSIMRIHHD
jgi:hypothetical protein